MIYKYTLDKSSKKFNCPNCNKKTFVRYTDVDTNSYIEPTIGRCDRESKCGYHSTPKGNKVLVSSTSTTHPILPPKPTHHNGCVMGDFGKNHKENNFVTYLLTHFVPVDVKHAIHKYFVYTSIHWKGATVFWQVDENYNICSGKVMLYDKTTGKRVKKPYPHINWMHKVLKSDAFVLQQCLFGLHQLHDCLIKTIAIVESEKTAIIMSIFRPDMLWMATGAKSNFKASLLNPLKGRKIMVFPDKTEYGDWNTKTIALKKFGFNIECSQLLEYKNLEDGDDLVDLIF